MSFKPSDTDEERCGRYIELRKRFQEIKNKYGYPEDDGRVKILNNLTWAIVSIVSRLNIILALNNKQFSHEQVGNLIGLSKGDLKTPIEADLLFVRLSFVALFQFQVETLLKIILREIEGKEPPKTYHKIVEQTLKVLQINDWERKLDILNILAYMRNCFHSNGVHTRRSKTFEIQNHRFEFVYGQSYLGGSLDEIHLAANEALTVLEEILDTDQVKNLTVPLPFVFVPSSPEPEY